MMAPTMTIGQAARHAGVGVETIRYYQRRGLIGKPSKRGGGIRQYDDETVDRICFIRKAKELGFTLKEIKELLELKLDPATTCKDVKHKAEAKIEDIESKVRSLNQMKRALVKLTKACNGQGKTNQCPILESLEK